MRVIAASLALAALVASAALASAASAPKTVLVVYRETGGAAGLERGLAVRRDGRATAWSKRPVAASCASRLGPTGLARLRRALREAAFGSLDAEYERAEPVGDVLRYRIRFAGRTVRAERGSEPLRLRRVGDLLHGLLGQQLALCRKLGR